MLHIERWKVIFVIILCLLGIAYAVPNVLTPKHRAWAEQHLPSWLPSKTVNLGLDLRGGSHLLMQADTDAVVTERMTALADTLRTDFRKEKIDIANLKLNDKAISFALRDQEQVNAARKIIVASEPQAGIDENAGAFTVTMTDQQVAEIKKQVIEQSIEIVRRRVDESGTKEPIIQRQGVDRIVVQLPGVDDPEHIKSLIGTTAKMAFHLVDFNASSTGMPSPGSMKLPLRESQGQDIVIQKRVMLSGERLTNAQPAYDQNGAPVVSFKFDSAGAKRFCDVTRDNVGKPFAIVLDNEVISAPVIRDAICGGSGQISGNFTVKEANDLALLLRAGALPAPLTIVEERTVGPTLGSDSVNAGKTAAIWAFVLVFIGMAVCYGLFGIFANIALALNMIFVFAILSILQATLTLPGIAGIILTIGIAVDANVLIYERIREEIKAGRSVLSAIDAGYKLAMSTIVDSNLTTLIVSMILFSFGTGPVKGFAVSMSIGIVTSLFSAIMITRLMVIYWLKKTRPTTLSL